MNSIIEAYWKNLDTRPFAPAQKTNVGHIPNDRLRDVRTGRREPIVFRYFDDHLAVCEDCQENKRLFTNNRYDPMKAVLSSKKSPMKEQRDLSLKDWIERIKQWLYMGIDDFGSNYGLVQGEASRSIYDEETLEAFKQALDKALGEFGDNAPRLKFITGPILSIADGSGPRHERTILTELAKHPLVDLYYSRYRQRLHFRIGARYQRLYCETEHPPGRFDGRQAHFVINGDLKPIALFADRLNRLLDDPFVEYCEDKTTKRFAFMTNDELEALAAEVKEQGLKYNELLDNELLAIAEEKGIPFK